MGINLIGALSGLFKKKIDGRTGEGQSEAIEVAKNLIGIAEVMMPEAEGAEKHDAVASALNAIIDIPGLNEEQEAVVFGLLIRAAGLAIGLFKKK